MSATLLLARRSLTRSRATLIASVGGVALALTLTLALDAVYAGVADQLTTYIDRSGADVWVAQSGVHNLHMVASWLPDSTTAAVREVPGVASASPILYATDTIAARDERGVAYVIGLPPDAPLGGPWDVAEGASRVGSGEAIIDRGLASRAGVGIGDNVTVLGRKAKVVGLSRGTATLLNTVAFVSLDDFRAGRGGAPIISFVLVTVTGGASPETVAASIERDVPGVSALSRRDFAAQERQLVMDMGADVISIMNVIGFVVALAVVALTVYVATLERRREYGVLKALGAGGPTLYRVVVAQAVMSVALGLAVALGVVLLLKSAIPLAGLDLELAVTPQSVAKAALFALVTAGLAAVQPIRQVSGIDPAIVFRRGAAA